MGSGAAEACGETELTFARPRGRQRRETRSTPATPGWTRRKAQEKEEGSSACGEQGYPLATAGVRAPDGTRPRSNLPPS